MEGNSLRVGNSFITGEMATLYKLTDEDGYTRRNEYNQMKWSVGQTNVVHEPGTKLCSNQVIHAYLDPYLAVLFNSQHADFIPGKMRLFKARGVIVAADSIQKVGVKSLEILEELEVPTLTVEQKRAIGIAILIAIPVISDATKNEILTTKDGNDIHDMLSSEGVDLIPYWCVRDVYSNGWCPSGLRNIVETVAVVYGINTLDIIRKTIAAQNDQ